MMVDHWALPFLKHQAGADLPDVQVASTVRMLHRHDINHEMVCVLARDRIARLSYQVDNLLGLLRTIQWAGQFREGGAGYHCPMCDNPNTAGHKPGCSIATALEPKP